MGAVLLSCACSPSTPDAGESGNSAKETIVDSAHRAPAASLPAPPAKPFEQREKTSLLEFSYAWPAAASAIPAIAEKLRKNMAVDKADALKMAGEDRKAAEQSSFPFHAHSLEKRWSVTADTPRFLALQSETYSYSGGAHGMTGYAVLLWDKARQREISVQAIMTSPAAFAAAIHDRFCEGLDKSRAEKRGAAVKRGDDPFSQCIDPMKEVLAPTSSDGKLIDGITVTIAPYGAGPYAEGSYAVPLSVDAQMRAAIKTEYQDAFGGG